MGDTELQECDRETGVRENERDRLRGREREKR